MSAAARLWPVAQSLPGRLAEADPALVLGVGLGLLAVVALFFALMILSRRQLRQEIREVVLALEELRSGRLKHRVDLDARSTMGTVADAVNRLAQDLAVRFGQAEEDQERVQGFLELAREFGVVSTDAEWTIRSASPGVQAILGWESDELVGKPVTALLDLDTWKEMLPKMARRGAVERSLVCRGRLVRRDGSTLQGEIAVRAVEGREGRPAGFVLLFRDLTEQLRLEAELRESEARYRGLVEGLAEGVAVVQDGQVVYANPALAGLLDVSAEELKHASIAAWVGVQDLLVFEEMLESLEKNPGESRRIRCLLVRPGGEALALVRVHATGIVQNGKPAVILSVFDETAEARIYEQLARHEVYLDAMLESTHDAILVFADTQDGSRVHMVNRAMLELLGLTQEEVLGTDELELRRKLRERGEGAEHLAAFLAAQEPLPRETTVSVNRESQRVLQASLVPLSDRSGRSVGRMLVVRDLTDQKAVERELEADAQRLLESKERLEQAYRELRAVHEKLEGRTEELNRLNQELRRLDEMKSNLLANVSHELQTPLVSVRGYTEMILKGRLGAITEEQKRGLTLSLKNIDRLIGMIDNLLAFSRLDREAANLNITQFRLQSVIDESLSLLQPQIEAKGITVQVRLEDPQVEIEGDRDKILQVFLNLLSNAVKFNRDGGSVEIAAQSGPEGQVEVSIRDTGPGIPEEDLERVFDRFYRVPGTGTEGSGIGLAVVRNILRLHGCTIRAGSRPGEGTTMTFTLPLAQAATRGGGPGGSAAAREAGDESGAPADNAPPPRGRPEASRAPHPPRLRIIRS